jgi:uncharacterized RDD family membrane protein YckC
LATTKTATSYELADNGARLMALFVDGTILFALGGIGFLTVREPGAGAGFFISLAYYWFFLTRNQGQTPGKALMKIRVIKADGTPISDSDALMRYIGYTVNTLTIIGWLWAFLDANQQGWHDKIAGTYVVKAN